MDAWSTPEPPPHSPGGIAVIPPSTLKTKTMKAFVAKLSESGKSACVMLRTSPFSLELIPVYIPNQNVKTGLSYEVGEEIEIPDNLKIVNWGDRTTKNGIPLKTLTLA